MSVIDPQGTGSAITELEPDRLYALSNVLQVDDKTSWLTPALGRYTPMNAYVLKEGGAALLVDPGITVHADSLLSQLSAVLNPGDELNLFFSRLGEFDCVTNASHVLERFQVDTIHAMFDARLFLDFLPKFSPPPREGTLWHGHETVTRVIASNDEVRVDAEGKRRCVTFTTPLRLLSTYWLYDEQTRTLFTSDAFGHVYGDSPSGPWIVDESNDNATVEMVRRQLLRKFKWMEDANLAPLIQNLRAIFDRFDVETIAPAYGSILRGRSVVERHVAMLDEVLESLVSDPC